MSDLIPVRRALLSASDKSGLVPFGRVLAGQGVEIVSTGGSARALREAGIAVTDVAAVTGFPEILGGRVKTLSPAIHGGILARRDDPTDQAEAAAQGIAPIDLVAVTLYPFEATVASGADEAEVVENIDIGGPALIRAAAKNHAFVVVLTEPAQYAAVADALAAEGGTRLALRRGLAAAAFARTAAYDAAIAAWAAAREGESLPERLVMVATRRQSLRYGENPHQRAAFYATGGGLADAVQVQGKELSYNNLNDLDAALAAVSAFAEPAVVIVKHANPCGVATGPDVAAAWQRALACDPVSAFGGIVALNRALDARVAAAIGGIFTEAIIAPAADEAARAVLAAKRNLRLLLGATAPGTGPVLRSIAGGLLVQTADDFTVGPADLAVVTRRVPTETETADLLFAFRVAKHVKSNAIVLARSGATVGIGAGQMSRVDAARIAALKAQDAGLAGPCVAASDAFFPFADGLAAVIAAGARAVIQPGGSLRDAEVIAAADAAGIAMVFTGKRHFRH